MRFDFLKKVTCWLVAFVLCVLLMSSFFGCTFVHIKRISGGDIEIDDDAYDSILQKYDEQGYKYEYKGTPVTITMAHWDSSGKTVESAVVNAVIKGFNRRYPDIKVNLEIVQSYEDTYGNFISAGTAADVFLVPDGAVFKWANNLTNLDDFISSSTILDSLDDVYPSCLTRYRYNGVTMGSGRQLALPKDVGPYVMYYNKDWFDEMGVAYPPADRVMSIDEATEMWSALTKRSGSRITGYGLGGLNIEGLVWSAGGDFLNSSRSNIPSDADTVAAIKKAYQYMQDTHIRYEIQPPASFTGTLSTSNLFSQQMIATVISGRWDVSSFRTLDFNWDIAYVPAFTDNGAEFALNNNMYSGSVGYTINKRLSGDKQLAAWKLIEYIASKEGQEILAKTGFQIPIYETVAMEDDIRNSEIALGPVNYDVFINSAMHQRYGLWQYRADVSWKENLYDLTSEKLYADLASDRITVDTFWNNVKSKASSYAW